MAPRKRTDPPLGASLSTFGPPEPLGGAGLRFVEATLLAKTLFPTRDAADQPFHCPLKSCREHASYGVTGGWDSPKSLLEHLHHSHFLLRYILVPTTDPLPQAPESSLHLDWEMALSVRGYDSVPVVPDDGFALQCRYCETNFGSYGPLLIHHLLTHLKLPPDQIFESDPTEGTGLVEEGKPSFLIDSSLLTGDAAREYHRTIRSGTKGRFFEASSFRCYYPGCEERFVDSDRFKRHLLQHEERTCSVCNPGLENSVAHLESAVTSGIIPPASNGELFKHTTSLENHTRHQHPPMYKVKRILDIILSKSDDFDEEQKNELRGLLPSEWGQKIEEGGVRITRMGGDGPECALDKRLQTVLGWPDFWVCPSNDNCIEFKEHNNLMRSHFNIAHVKKEVSPKRILSCSRGCGFSIASPKRLKTHEDGSCKTIQKTAFCESCTCEFSRRTLKEVIVEGIKMKYCGTCRTRLRKESDSGHEDGTPSMGMTDLLPFGPPAIHPPSESDRQPDPILPIKPAVFPPPNLS